MRTQSLANTVTPSQLKTSLSLLVEAQIPAFIWGSPGTGKSQIVAQVAESLGRELIDVRALLLDPVDLRGLPHVDKNGRAQWATPGFLPTDGEGILLLDELNAAPPMVMAACYQLILDRKLGEYTLPDGWSVLAAGNLDTDRAVTNKMPTALANRFAHFELITESSEWRKWACGNNVRPEVVGFIGFRPELLHSFDPKSGEKAFPTPRSWEALTKAMNTNPPKEVELQIYSGIIGQAAALELTGFLRVFRSLPNIDNVLMNPDTAKIPTDPATLYAVSSALSRRACDNNFDRIKTYADRLPTEFTVLTIADSVRRDEELQNTTAFINFAAENSDVIL